MRLRHVTIGGKASEAPPKRLWIRRRPAGDFRVYRFNKFIGLSYAAIGVWLLHETMYRHFKQEAFRALFVRIKSRGTIA